MSPHVLLPSTSSSCHAVPPPQPGTPIVSGKVASVQPFQSTPAEPDGVSQRLQTGESMEPVGAGDSDDLHASTGTPCLPPSNTPAAVVAALAAAAAASPSLVGALEGTFGGDGLQPTFKSPEESDAELAQALLLKGYRLSEDTAGDADLTFPVDFHTPLNYEIYSFISQCINAQLKSGHAAEVTEKIPSESVPSRTGDGCAAEGLSPGGPVMLQVKQERGQDGKSSWTTTAVAAGQWPSERTSAGMEESETQDGTEARDHRGRCSSRTERKQWRHKQRDGGERTGSAPPECGHPVSVVGSAPFPSQYVFSPSLSAVDKPSCPASEPIDIRKVCPSEGDDKQETSNTVQSTSTSAPLVDPPPSAYPQSLSSGSCCASSPPQPVTGNESGAASAVRAPPGLSGPDINTALLRAAFLGRVDIIEKCVQRGGDVCFADRVGRTALHYGAATGLEPIVRLLLSAGADRQINRRDRKSWTPLLIAVTKTHVACVRLLLERGAKVGMTLCHRCAPCRSGNRTNSVHRGTAPVLPTAAENNEVWDASAAGRGEEEGRNTSHQRPESAMTEDRRPDGADTREAGVPTEMKTRGSEGTQPLQTWSAAIHFAAIKGSAEITRLLLEHGATVNDLDSDRRPPLHYAACRDNWQYVKWLVSRGARLDLVDINGRSALHAAAMKGQLQNAQCILEGGDDFTALALLRTKDKWDITPAQLAKLHGQNAMYLLLRSYKEQLESALGEPEGQAEAAVDPDILLLNQTITEVLATGMQEVKKSKLERTVNRLGTVVCLKAYQKTMMIQGMGGMLVADGSRPKTPGGVFFTLLREMARHGEISREDLIYIDMEDGEAKKAQRRRARQQQAAVVADPASHQVCSQQRKRSPRRPVGRSVAPDTNRTNTGLAGDAEPRKDKPLPRSKAQRQNSAKTGRPQSSRGSAKVSAAAPPQQVALNNPLSFLAAISAAGLPGPPSNFVLPPGQRPASALSSKSNGRSSPRGACPFTPLARAIDAESLPNSGGSTPQQCSMSAPTGGHVVVGGNPAMSTSGAGNNFYPYPVYPIYPFWPMGFPTPLSPPPLQGVTGRQISNGTSQGVTIPSGCSTSGTAMYGHAVSFPPGVAAAYGLSLPEAGAVEKKNFRRRQQQHQPNKEEKRETVSGSSGQTAPGTQQGTGVRVTEGNELGNASTHRKNTSVVQSKEAARSTAKEIETSVASAVGHHFGGQSKGPIPNRVWAPKKRGGSTAASSGGGGRGRGVDGGGRGRGVGSRGGRRSLDVGAPPPTQR
ncbi:ankyrin repeat-containing protein [Cystoisospora suis]|uniref:Ankyrin repeat-containing protein n=1 Tax=Cystoisospora suis TaxID=483139 RepID=A0A2C6LGK4_9APIC|nr:ankyrin repeat-containing protein [Cystoisospora suis]